jgi:hypothetical protein
MSDFKRRTFIKTGTLGTMALTLLPGLSGYVSSLDPSSGPRFKISLAQWSLHRSLKNKTLDHLDFPRVAAVDFGIYGVEYVNTFFKDKASDSQYLAEMNKRAGDAGVKQLLIMIDGEGGLAELDDTTRKTAVTNHYKWVEAAKTLGCHSIRVNAYGVSDDGAALHAAAVDGLGMLTSFAEKVGINVIVENHGGLSSDGKWLAGVIKEVNIWFFRILKFCLKHTDGRGTAIVVEGCCRHIPLPKAVSASRMTLMQETKPRSTIQRMISIVKSSYKGYLGYRMKALVCQNMMA